MTCLQYNLVLYLLLWPVVQNIFLMALVRNANFAISFRFNLSDLSKSRGQENKWLHDSLTKDELDTTELYSDDSVQDTLLDSVSSQETPDLNCTDPLDHVEWHDPGLIGSFAVLILINILVVAGNTLVIAAVFSSSKLRSVTYLFIVSLAVADMSLGMMVLPFSVTVEVFDTWLFGPLWCSVWLAVDVWMSTASILNLVVISFDR